MTDSLLGLDEPPQPRGSGNSGAYRVLARKYRPQTFSELIGQDAMVTTLANAIRRDRLAPAFLLTGVRGGGPADKAWRKGGDVIVQFAGKDITNIYDYTYALDAVKVGKPVSIEVLRKGNRVKLSITPAARK